MIQPASTGPLENGLNPAHGATIPDAVSMQVDLRPALPRVLDQGERGTCLAFATTVGHEQVRATSTSIHEDLSEEVLYWASKQVDKNVAPGTSFRSAAEALQRWGQPAEEVWPYDAARIDSDHSYQPPPEALEPDICYKARLAQIECSVTTLREHLNRKQAVAIGILLWPDFFTPDNGSIAMPTVGTALLGGHAISVVGYHDETSTLGDTEAGTPISTGYFIIRNSWGEEWGEAGYGYLPYSYIIDFGAEAWVVEEN